MKFIEKLRVLSKTEKVLLFSNMIFAIAAVIFSILSLIYIDDESFEFIIFPCLSITLLLQGLRMLIIKHQRNVPIALFSLATSIFIIFVFCMKLFVST